MKLDYTDCPMCGKFLKVRDPWSYAGVMCGNQEEIILARAAGKPVPEYHQFYSETMKTYTRVVVEFQLTPTRIVRFIRFSDTDYTTIYDRDGKLILRIPLELEPDFPDLTKLKQKLLTYINFS